MTMKSDSLFHYGSLGMGTICTHFKLNQRFYRLHKITPATDKERSDIEIKDMDFTMTHVRFGCSHLHPIGHLTHKRRSDSAPDPDGVLKEVVRIKIRQYRNIYLNRPDPKAFLLLVVDTSGRMYDYFIRLFSCIITVRDLLYLMNCRRNRISFDSFTLLVHS